MKKLNFLVVIVVLVLAGCGNPAGGGEGINPNTALLGKWKGPLIISGSLSYYEIWIQNADGSTITSFEIVTGTHHGLSSGTYDLYTGTYTLEFPVPGDPLQVDMITIFTEVHPNLSHVVLPININLRIEMITATQFKVVNSGNIYNKQ